MLLEFFPLAAFGVAYYFYDFYVATSALMVAMGMLLAVRVLLQNKRERLFFISCVLVWVFGSLTLLLQDKIFLQWSPTVFAWLIALVLLLSELISKANLIETITTKINPKFHLPKQAWRHVNLGWALGFAGKGGLNLYVALYHTESTWVTFKLLGQPALTILFLLLTLYYLRHDILAKPNKEAVEDGIT